MYASKLPHTQIDRFHHIARLGVYALLTLSVIATTVSLNSPGTSVGNGKARAADIPKCETVESILRAFNDCVKANCPVITQCNLCNALYQTAVTRNEQVDNDITSGRCKSDYNNGNNDNDCIFYGCEANGCGKGMMSVWGNWNGKCQHAGAGEFKCVFDAKCGTGPSTTGSGSSGASGVNTGGYSATVSLTEGYEFSYTFTFPGATPDKAVDVYWNLFGSDEKVGTFPLNSGTLPVTTLLNAVPRPTNKQKCGTAVSWYVKVHDDAGTTSPKQSTTVGGPGCTAPAPAPASPSAPTPTPDGSYSATYENGAVEYRFPGTNDENAFVMLNALSKTLGSIKSGQLRVGVTDENKQSICGEYIWHVKTTGTGTGTRSPDISANVTCPSSGTTATTPTLVSYSVSSEGGTVSTDGHTLTISKSHAKQIVVTATTSNPGKETNGALSQGKLNVYGSVSPGIGATPISSDNIVSPNANGANAVFTWKFVKPAGLETDFQANFYPGTDKIQERVIIKVVNDPIVCKQTALNCNASSNTNKYYEQEGIQGKYFSDDKCASAITNLTEYCGVAVFNPGDGGPVTIPNRLWLKYVVTIPNAPQNGGKRFAIGARNSDPNTLRTCVGDIGSAAFTSSLGAQFVECRRGDNSRTLIVKLVGQEEIKSWLAGNELLWGVAVTEPNQSTGIKIVTGRSTGGTSVVNSIKHTGETEQYIEFINTVVLP